MMMMGSELRSAGVGVVLASVVAVSGLAGAARGQTVQHVRTMTVDSIGEGGLGPRDFGRIVRLSGRLAAVGAPSGSEYVYSGSNDNGDIVIAPAGQVYLIDALAGTRVSELGFSGTGAIVGRLGNVLAFDGERAVSSTVNFFNSFPRSGFAAVWDADQAPVVDSSGVLFLPNYLFKPFENERFGTALAISDDIVVVGSIDDDRFLTPPQSGGGAAVVYDALNGDELVVLGPNDPAPGAAFGQSAAIEGDLIFVGGRNAMYAFDRVTGQQVRKTNAPNTLASFAGVLDTDAGRVAAGAVDNVYVFNAATGQQLRRFQNPLAGQPFARMAHTGFLGELGNDVSISGDYVVAPCRLCTVTPGLTRDGAVFVFSISQNRLVATLSSPDPVDDGGFGTSVSIDGNLIVVGELLPGVGDDPRPPRGLVHTYRIQLGGCDAVDFNGDQSADFFDVLLFLNFFNDQAPIADFNMDGQINFFDTLEFLGTLGGCSR